MISSAGSSGSKAGGCSERSSSHFDERPRAPPMTASKRFTLRAGRNAKAAADATLGRLAVGALRAIRATSRTHMADLAGGVMRRLGPRLKEHRIGRANLTAAFPEKSAAEIETILHRSEEHTSELQALRH